LGEYSTRGLHALFGEVNVQSGYFDFDGTLAGTKRDIIEGLQKILSEAGCVVDDDFIAKRTGIGARLLIKEALEENKIPYNDDLIEKIIERLLRTRMNSLKRIRLFDGTVELLDSLYEWIRIALATMSLRKSLYGILKEKKLAKYFEVVIDADDGIKPKPAPETFLKCATKMGLDSKNCVLVGDSVAGIKAAKAAGMKYMAVASGFYIADELIKEDPDLLVDSVNDKETILSVLL